MFLIGGRNRAMGQYRRNPAWWWRLRRWRQIIEARAARCERLGIKFVQVVVPEKLTIMPDWCAKPLIDPKLAPAVRLAKVMAASPVASNYVDLVPVLVTAARREEVFLKTDTHWNYKGCFIAYSRICDPIGIKPRDDLLVRPYRDFDQPMNLGIKLDPPIPERFRLHYTLQDAKRIWVNELVTKLMDAGGAGSLRGCQARYENASSSADPRRLMIFGDSNSHFDPIELTGMLAETFREVHFVWSSSLDWRLIEEVRPAILIAEIAERFLKRVVDDKFDVKATVAARMRAQSLDLTA